MATRIYTRGGDGGETGLIGGTRLPKDAPRIDAYGDVDELCAAVGVALTEAPPADIAAVLRRIQNLLFELGAELAAPPGARGGGVTDGDVTAIESLIDRFAAPLPRLKHFILPGGSRVAAALHHCRTVCRRAERRVVTLRALEPETSAISVGFLNRLSDLLFVLGRAANHAAGVEDIPWHSRD